MDEGLRSRSADLIALVKEADIGVERQARSPLAARGGNLAQIVDASGRIADATPGCDAGPCSPATSCDADCAGRSPW